MTTLTETSVAGNDDRRDNENDNNGQKLMVALDVDGTLVDHDGHMSPGVRESAQAVVAAGHEVMIATGRSLNATLPIIEKIGIERGYSVGWTAWLDIAAAGVTKASALENLRGRLGIEQHLTVAIGDGRNDIEMLSWAGRGVAMGQAPEEVIAAADEVTHSVFDDGAAHVLRSLL